MIYSYLEFYLTGWACMVCLHAALTGFDPKATDHKKFLTETLLWPYYLPVGVIAFFVGFVYGFRNGLKRKNKEK